MRTYEISGKTCAYNRAIAIQCATERCEKPREIAGTPLNGYRDRPRYTREKLKEDIAAYCNVSPATAKNWISKSKKASSPDTKEQVFKLEAFFNLQRGQLLRVLQDNNTEDNAMNAVSNSRELDSARELYGILLETIEAAIPSYRGFCKSGGYITAFDSMEDRRYETILTIKKSAMDIPQHIRDLAIALVNNIYGPESDSPDSFFETEEFKEFISSDDYQEYIKEEFPDGHNYEIDKLNYCEHKKEESFACLDEIFARYLCNRAANT